MLSRPSDDNPGTDPTRRVTESTAAEVEERSIAAASDETFLNVAVEPDSAAKCANGLSRAA
jgi:hypothetical protein